MLALALVTVLACNAAHTAPVPTDILTKKTSIRTGIGTIHDPVSTKSKDAQAYYDQGVAYLHSYVWIEAARSFHQAARLDPKLAMAHVGLSFAYTGLGDKAKARTELAAAQKLEAGASEKEKRRIAVRAAQIAAIDAPEDRELLGRYVAAIDAAARKYPDDVEILLWRGVADEPLPNGRGQMGGEESIGWYEKVLAIAPDHFAAHHYLIHSYENTGDIAQALEHGLAYAKACPNIPHAQHMLGHDLRRVGKVTEAIAAFEKADALEKAYYKKEGIPAALDWHRPHNLHLLALCHLHQGRAKKAEALIREAQKLAPADEWAEFNRRELASFLLSRGRVAEALTAADALSKGRFPAARTMGPVLAGEALVASGKIADAEARATLADAELAKVSGDYALVWQYYLPPYIDLLRGEIAVANGTPGGRAKVQEALTRARSLPGPDAWSLALFELERAARVARKTGDWDLARWIASQMAEHDPSYGGTHIALAIVLKKDGKADDAAKELAEAKRLWKAADPGLVNAE